MGARGPKPGYKKTRAAQEAGAAAKAAPVAPTPGKKRGAAAALPDAGDAATAATQAATLPPIDGDPPPAPAAPVVAPLSAADRENPDKLTGEALRTLAHRRGLARSAVQTMDDDKIRRELRYLTYRQYSEA